MAIEIITEYINLSTRGHADVIDITQQVASVIEKNKIIDGTVTIFVPGATGAVTTIEFEPELVKDTKELFFEIVKEQKKYYHNTTHSQGNATSHLRATLIGPSLTVPITQGRMNLGIWQQIVFIDFDNRARQRELVLKIIGEKKK